MAICCISTRESPQTVETVLPNDLFRQHLAEYFGRKTKSIVINYTSDTFDADSHKIYMAQSATIIYLLNT